MKDHQPTGNGWVKANRSPHVEPLFARSHHAACLLWLIALRAWRGPGRNAVGLEPGEARIGDWGNCGFTRSEYRHAIKILAEFGQCSFRATNLGTVAKLLSPEIFDINIDCGVTERTANDHQTATPQPCSSHEITIEQPASDPGAATNKKERIEEVQLKKEKNGSVAEFVGRRVKQFAAPRVWLRAGPSRLPP